MSTVWPIDRFEESLKRRSAEVVTGELFSEDDPYVFRENKNGYSVLRDHISKSLAIETANIRIIGSALTGFSLSPDTYSRAFGVTSDIDVLVVSERLFDFAWSTILKWHYPRKGNHLDATDKDWMSNRRREVYWGWFVPDKIRYPGLSRPTALDPLRDLSTNWFETFKGLSIHAEISDRDVNGRLYRTWDHATLYHANSLSRVKSLLTKS